MLCVTASLTPGRAARARYAELGTPADDMLDGMGQPVLDDRALMARVIERDTHALAALYDRYSRPAFSLALRILSNRELAEDVVQEVFLAVWRDAARFDTARGAFSSYLLSMVHHKAVDVVRREEGIRKRGNALGVLELGETGDRCVEDEVWSTMRSEKVRAALVQIPPNQREALELAYFGGHTQREIAALTDTPLGTVKTRMLAGMRRLRELLESSVLTPEEVAGR
jgi:RNA polymerase sigma-70 factor (ECF subfamily)